MQSTIPISSIIVNTRIRKDMGNIRDLANSIESIGLLSPIVINEENKLLAGERRYQACKLLGWKEVPVNIIETASAEQNLVVEIAENQNRKSFNKEELINAGIELERIEKIKAEERRRETQQRFSREVPNLAPLGEEDPVENLPHDLEEQEGPSKGKVRDIVAKKLGMSHSQYEKEKYIYSHRDVLTEGEYNDWNTGAVSTNKTYNRVKSIIKPEVITEVQEIIPSDYEDIKKENKNLRGQRDEYASRCKSKSQEIRDLKTKQNKRSRPTMVEYETIIGDIVEEKDKEIEDISQKLEESISQNTTLKDQISKAKSQLTKAKKEMRKLKKSYLPKAIQNGEAAIDFYNETSEFVSDILSPFRYTPTIVENQENLAGEYIEKACNMLIDAASDLLKRFKTEDIIEGRILND